MKIVDISWPITPDMTTYKNVHPMQIESLKTYAHDLVAETVLTMHTHTGTHIDMPSHFIESGATSTQYDLAQCCGICQVIDMTSCRDSITEKDIREHTLASKATIVLLKTSNSELPSIGPFEPAFVYLAASGAAYLASKNITAVGIDYLGIERADPDHATHKTLLSRGIAIIEGLRLAHVVPGVYTLICLPLAVQNVEAVPARAIIMTPINWTRVI